MNSVSVGWHAPTGSVQSNVPAGSKVHELGSQTCGIVPQLPHAVDV
jgi:hypothetical protein